MNDMVGVQLLIQGRVQGVGYRFYAQETAESLGVCGWVRNLPSGDVECHAEGKKSTLEDYIAQLKKGPPLARVDHLDTQWGVPCGHCKAFSIYS